MKRKQPRPLLNKPDLHEERNGAHLLVWGHQAQWMVVDDELYAFLGLLNGRRDLKKILRDHARRTQRPLDKVQAEGLAVLEELKGRRLLDRTSPAPPSDSDAPHIANVTINLTNRCNLRCPWCYNVDRQAPEAPIDALMDALERARPLFSNDASFIVLGGEPLLRPQRLFVALERAESIFAGPSMISTNGTLLSEEMVTQLAARRVEVQVSLDGSSAEKHDTIRGSGVFHKATAGIRRLVEAGLYTIISLVYSRQNIDDFEPYLDLALALGVNEARLIPLRLIGQGLAHREQAPDQMATFEHLLDILDRRPELRPLLRRDFFSISATICRFSTPRTGCGVGSRVVFVDADGAIYPCPNHVTPSYRCGNLLEKDLDELFLRSPVMKECRQLYHVEQLERCRDCVFRYWCAGDCRGEALALTGDPTQPSPHCSELRRLFHRLLWLIANDDPRLAPSPTDPNGQAAKNSFL